MGSDSVLSVVRMATGIGQVIYRYCVVRITGETALHTDVTMIYRCSCSLCRILIFSKESIQHAPFMSGISCV